MVRDAVPIDISGLPELVKLLEEVKRSGTPRALRRGDEAMGTLVPPRPARQRHRSTWKPSEDDLAAFRSAAGGWKDVDVDRFLKDVYESRGSARPPVEL